MAQELCKYPQTTSNLFKATLHISQLSYLSLKTKFETFHLYVRLPVNKCQEFLHFSPVRKEDAQKVLKIENSLELRY